MAYSTETDVEALLLEDISSTTTPNTTQVATWIDQADAYIDEFTGTLFDTALESSEIQSYDGRGFVRTDLGPIVSITSIYADQNGFNAESRDFQLLIEGLTASDDFYLDEFDSKMIHFKTSTTGNVPVRGIQNLKITYIHGHASVPALVNELSTLLTAQKVLVAKVSNNTFSSQDSITIGPIRIDKSSVTTGNLMALQNYINDRKKLLGTFQIKGRNII